MIKKLLAALLLSAPFYVFAACEDKVPHGMPTTPVKTTELCRSQYVVKYYDACKVPLFVAEYLQASEIGGTEPRGATFRIDYELPEWLRATNGDYVGSGYDRGHMAAAANYQNDALAMEESFLISNAIPQTPRLNRGVWKAIEMRSRALAVKHSGVHIISGGVFEENPTKIGSGLCVPIYTYKVIINKTKNQGVAYITENTNDIRGPSQKYQVPISWVEAVTGMNFTPSLDESKAATLKEKIGPEMTTK